MQYISFMQFKERKDDLSNQIENLKNTLTQLNSLEDIKKIELEQLRGRFGELERIGQNLKESKEKDKDLIELINNRKKEVEKLFEQTQSQIKDIQNNKIQLTNYIHQLNGAYSEIIELEKKINSEGDNNEAN